MGRGNAESRAPLAIVGRTERLPSTVPDADTLWSAGRLLACRWRADTASVWPELGAVAMRVDEVVRLRPVTPGQAAARFRWLLSLELDEALLRGVGSEADDVESARLSTALRVMVSAWGRRHRRDGSSVSAALEDAVSQVEKMLMGLA